MSSGRRGLALGGVRPLDGSGRTCAFELPSDDLLTHGVVVGMTGSGKTGLLMTLVEETLRSGIPVVMIDVKGDLPNLLLTFPNLAAQEFAPWVDAAGPGGPGGPPLEAAESIAGSWRQQLAGWQLGPSDVAALRAAIAPRVFTPGLIAGEPLHVLSSLERPGNLVELRSRGSARVVERVDLAAPALDWTRPRSHAQSRPRGVERVR